MKETGLKEERWEKIRWLIANEKISTQNELSRRLEEEGFPVTQATISRDIRLLRLVKTVSPDGGYHYEIARSREDGTAQKFRGIYHNAVVSVDSAQNLVVIRCHAGMAQGICAIVDEMKLPDVMGSIAGDDTILIIARTTEGASQVVTRLRRLGEGAE